MKPVLILLGLFMLRIGFTVLLIGAVHSLLKNDVGTAMNNSIAAGVLWWLTDVLKIVIDT